MDSHADDSDRLFLIAENLAQDFSLFPRATESSSIEHHVQGLLSADEITRHCELLRNMDIDSYIESVVTPAEDPTRLAAPLLIRELGGRLTNEELEGPFYATFMEMEFSNGPREVAFIAQDRRVKNGAWMPEHHLAAARIIEECSKRSIPIVSMMDTPGADAEEAANANNQAHSISRLIAEMCNVDVPNLGIIFGLGYSGGAIPLAASNMILSLKDGVFSTIQPRGLANIARRLNLSWQECAKYVGLSPFELYRQGNIDGVIDYAAGEPGSNLENLRLAIVSGIERVESNAKDFVAENPYIFDSYKRNLERYLNPSEQLQVMETSASLSQTKAPTEYSNVFGVTYRYLRYLGTRKRIKATSTHQYGRLAQQELPKGELNERAERERRLTFLKWIHDPEKVIYDDTLARAWKNYNEKKQAVHDERGRIAKLIFGEPKKNYEEARTQLLLSMSMYLYNRWKGEAAANLKALRQYLANHLDTRLLLRKGDIEDPAALLKAIPQDSRLGELFRERFTHEGKKLLVSGGIQDKSQGYLRSQLAAELNLILTGPAIHTDLDPALLSDDVKRLIAAGASDLAINRGILDSSFGSYLVSRDQKGAPVPFSDMTVLEVLVQDDLREDFIQECENLLLFDSVYDQIISNLDSIAEEAETSRNLAKSSVAQLLETTLTLATSSIADGNLGVESGSPEANQERLKQQFFQWYLRVADLPRSKEFFHSVEEWKKGSFTHLSDTLLVVVTFLFEKLLVSYLQSEYEEKRYDGRISPRNIGRRKDFWNRLSIAYRDLLIQNLLKKTKGSPVVEYSAIIDKFFREFEELNGDLISSDPRQFPGFRLSIESALEKGLPPCGIVTGIGTFDDGKECLRVGAVVSNIAFQAGAFDMASAEKFCKLLVECAEQQLPVICFVSSGGMQTKEGAGALFSMAAVNDRITRFVRDSDLPVIVFGFGDCTGGAQASFVTHPLAQTYYFSGTNMPFAGQIVVSSNLPSNATLSNYLSLVPGAMQGLIKNPFFPDLDDELKKIDPNIPVAQITVADAVQRVMAGLLVLERPQPLVAQTRYTREDLIQPVRRVLIHARGCTAAKLIRVAQREGIEVVLVQSDPDMDSAVVDQLGDSDQVVCIGGNTPDESYLNAMSVVSVAEHEKADSLHPGIGFLSENSQFAELCISHGLNFIGPPVSSMETMGNKSNAINTALKRHVPVVPGSHGILTSVERAAEVAEEIGYPVLIKAVHGGGGKGIQVVEQPAQFHELFHRVAVEAKAAFGNGDVYLEKYVTSLRHIEVQLLRDNHGNTRVLGLRDCSVQRDKQKVVEESDSTMLSADLRRGVLDYTAAIADEVNYVGAGTVEFIFDLANDAVYFMEMNTRLQVEHPVTEMVSGVDIVAQQFAIAGGGSIEDLKIGQNGYAIEARINAEKILQDSDGVLSFRPDPGQVLECDFPEVEGIDVIACVSPGKFVSPFYDSMVAQVIAHGKDRNDTIQKLLSYLDTVNLTGICSNIPLLKKILSDRVFHSGEYDTDYLPDLLQRLDSDALIEEVTQQSGNLGQHLDRAVIQIEGGEELKVLAQSTGIFYATPTPTDPPYITVGDRISVNQPLCQLEAMKIFSPLSLADYNHGEEELYPSETTYEVTRINISTGQQVNVGDLLFVVKPVS